MTTAEGAPYLTTEEFGELWRPLRETERKLAELLIAVASARIREIKPDADVSVAKLAVLQVVVPVLSRLRESQVAATSLTTTVGDRTTSVTFADAAKMLVFDDSFFDLLGVSASPVPHWYFGD